MRDTFIKYLKKKQPISTTGAFLHTYHWFSASNVADKVYSNPNFREPSLTDPQEKKIAIYCVHGTADYPWAFTKIAQRLILSGLDPNIVSIHLIAFDHRYQGKDICFFARQLIEKIKRNGHEHVILMGHSRGGLINAFAAEYYAEEYNINVGLVINICSPFGGSYLANPVTSFFSDSIAQMASGCLFLQDLNKKIANSDKNYYFLAAEQDSIVSPLAAFNLEYMKKKPESFFVYDRHGHLSILSSHRVVKEICNFLKPLKSLFQSPDESEQLSITRPD